MKKNHALKKIRFKKRHEGLTCVGKNKNKNKKRGRCGCQT
jgi:hypothetical protein